MLQPKFSEKTRSVRLRIQIRGQFCVRQVSAGGYSSRCAQSPRLQVGDFWYLLQEGRCQGGWRGARRKEEAFLGGGRLWSVTPSRIGVGTEAGGGRGGQRGAAAAEAGRGRRGSGKRGLPAVGTAELGARQTACNKQLGETCCVF